APPPHHTGRSRHPARRPGAPRPARRVEAGPPGPPHRHLPAGRRDRHRRPHRRRTAGAGARPGRGGGEPRRRRRQYRDGGRRPGGAGRQHHPLRHHRPVRREPHPVCQQRRRCGARLPLPRHDRGGGQHPLRHPLPRPGEGRAVVHRGGQGAAADLWLGRQWQLLASLGRGLPEGGGNRGDACALSRLLPAGRRDAGGRGGFRLRHHRHLHRACPVRRLPPARRHHRPPRGRAAAGADAEGERHAGCRSRHLVRPLRAAEDAARHRPGPRRGARAHPDAADRAAPAIGLRRPALHPAARGGRLHPRERPALAGHRPRRPHLARL
ncbi:MAG: BUG/TctC family periplasmic protein, partial [uncultured Craurococcus sp.]